MYYISVLIPMMAFSQNVDVASEISQQLGIPQSSIQFFQVNSSVDKIEYAVKVASLSTLGITTDINLTEINSLVSQNYRLRQQLHKFKKDLVRIEQSVNFQKTFHHQKELQGLKKEVQRLNGLVKSYSTSIYYIKQEAQTTIQNAINNLSVQTKNNESQTQH